MSDVLCIYYSRTGNTKKTMEEIAQALGAELVELRDAAERSGALGWLRCGLDAMRRTAQPVLPFQTARPLSDYKLVVVGSPIWAGRCSSVARSFLKEHGGELKAAAYVLTRGSENKSQEVFDQMDLHTPCGHQAAVSLRRGSVGYNFWQEEFLRQAREYLDQERQKEALKQAKKQEPKRKAAPAKERIQVRTQESAPVQEPAPEQAQESTQIPASAPGQAQEPVSAQKAAEPAPAEEASQAPEEISEQTREQ